MSVHFFGGRHYFGAEAYEQWIAALPHADGPADLVLGEAVRGRSAAAEFCTRAAAPCPAAGGSLRQAAGAYRREVETAQASFADLTPFRWDNPARAAWGSSQQRWAAAAAVAEMLDHERGAVAALELALAAMD